MQMQMQMRMQMQMQLRVKASEYKKTLTVGERRPHALAGMTDPFRNNYIVILEKTDVWLHDCSGHCISNAMTQEDCYNVANC